MSYTTESPEYVQHFLDHILGPGKPFKVIFRKTDGSQRELKGSLIPSDTRKENVPIETDEGIKSFNINRVLWIGELD